MKNKYFYKTHPTSCDPDDFWGQVKRTVDGKPVSQAQINLIVEEIIAKLKLKRNDFLLDLCCGNGALSNILLGSCKKVFGVDYSEYLINIAKENFESENQEYHLEDVSEFVEKEKLTNKSFNFKNFNKALCYGAFQYLSENNSKKFLINLNKNFPNIELFFIGNLPDMDRADKYFRDKKNLDIKNLKNPDSPIGIWRDIDSFKELANSCGWDAKFSYMPINYYGAHYRYDALLTKKI